MDPSPRKGRLNSFFLHFLFFLDLVSGTLGVPRAQDPSQDLPRGWYRRGAGTA